VTLASRLAKASWRRRRPSEKETGSRQRRGRRQLKLIATRTFGSGSVLLRYEPDLNQQ
jgi:hypothetical protein